MTSDSEKRAREEAAPDARERSLATAPTYGMLPEARRRAARCGPAVGEISLRMEVVTPILGGSSQTRAIDEVDVIRAATVRGHLRFWWRALCEPDFQRPEDLYAAESALWGRAATDEGGRSAIEIQIDVQYPRTEQEKRESRDESDIDLQRTAGAYALWPARKENRTSTPAAPRRRPGTQFLLTLVAPKDREAELHNVVRAWLLFGGYGSRTRRGLGSFKVVDDAKQWLPASAARDALVALFGRDVLATPLRAAGNTPWLGGAALHVGKPDGDAVKAWTTALDWLKAFRQGTNGNSGDRAREPGANNRPSISNWPEPDKVRHLRGKTTAHPPRHNATPAWPRAGFGLPIAGQFQKNARNGGRLEEPDSFELRWRSGQDEHDRLASPLIVKALPLADGTFVPCALWLNRAYPAGEVVLRGVNNSAAPFDRLVASGDTPRFSALAGKHSLREAFLDWLHARYQTTVVAP